MPTPADRRGFTLIEMLIVITVIAVLAALLIPAISLAKRELGKVRCSNNLQQVGMGIEVMRQERDDLFPGRLVDLFDKAYSGPFEPGIGKILICPVDTSRGTNGFNRYSGWAQFDDLREDIISGREAEPPRAYKTMSCSYLYETSDQLLDYQSGDPDEGVLKNLYRDEPIPVDPATGLYAKVSWQTGKKVQVKHGNLRAGSTSDFGDPFPTSYMPVLRCYWHNRWTIANSRVEEKMINLSWDLNVFKSIPYWETTVNPDIPLPN
ncbi:MAG TPA: type II secretion system protein [Planctomycetota bacterium]|nr:type II secretion system protein [Planctomycetota bacterium]